MRDSIPDNLSRMLAMIQDLVRHKWDANGLILTAIQQHEAASRDEKLRKLLHHINVANRYWLLLSLDLPFDYKREIEVPATLEELAKQYDNTRALELDWIERLTDAELERHISPGHLPGHIYTVAQGMMQIALHSQGHRSQCAMRLRDLGGEPPMTDYIVWIKDKKFPERSMGAKEVRDAQK